MSRFMNMNININNMNIMPNNMGIMNNNMTPNYYYLPSNLVADVAVIRPNPYANDYYLLLRFILNNVCYILKIEKIESSNSILFSCHNEDDYITSLYEYSCSIPYKDLKNMNKAFLICDNVNQIFTSIENALIKEKNRAIPRIDFFQNNEDAICFFLRIPLISGQIEDLSIILQKNERNIKIQFDKLAKRYEKIKKIILNDRYDKYKNLNLRNLVDPSGIHGSIFSLYGTPKSPDI